MWRPRVHHLAVPYRLLLVHVKVVQELERLYHDGLALVTLPDVRVRLYLQRGKHT